MADNTPQNGTATIAADSVTQINGAASSGVLVQRNKVGYGDDGSYQDVSLAYPMPVSTSSAKNNWGQVVAVAAGVTQTIINIPSSVSGYRLKGLLAHGIGDGYFVVQVSSTTVFSGRIRSSAPMLIVMLPNGVAVPTGSTVSLKVTNETGSTADYEATLLGE